MNNKNIKSILDAEEKAKIILIDAQKEYDKIIFESEELIAKNKDATIKFMKEEKKDSINKANKEAENIYQNTIIDKKTELLAKKEELQSKIEDIEKNITKEILDKWLL